MPKFVTIKELAKELHLSHSTVSRALRNHKGISENTKKRVQELANSLGYKTNAAASNFYNKKSKTIAVIIPDITISFFAKIFEVIQKELEASGYMVALFNTIESYESEVRAVEHCLDQRVAGIIAAISINTKNLAHFEKVLFYDVPLIFVDRVANFLPVPKIVTDDYQAAYDATSHLIQQGCVCIAHVAASKTLNNSNKRLYGYLDALSAHAIEADEALIHYENHDDKRLFHFLEKCIYDYPKLDGVFVFNDYIAYDTVNILQELGKHVPQNIAVFGFSDDPISNYMSPKLSTVKQMSVNLGEEAARKMKAVLEENSPLNDEKIIVKASLVIRESTF